MSLFGFNAGLLAMQVEGARAVWPGHKSDELFVFGRDNQMTVAQISDISGDVWVKTVCHRSFTRKMCVFDQYTCIISRTR
jgi:hypothetical protein